MGRFTSADNIIPDGIQGWDHYAYVGNSPINYSDPSGHFKDDQLKLWFGDDWRDRFSAIMTAFLSKAELGDVLHGEELSIMFVLDQDGTLAAWDLQSKSVEDVSNYNDVDPETTALYRPNSAGEGPTETDWKLLPNPSLGEGIGNPAYGDPRYQQVYNLDCSTCNESYELPHGWFQGENNGVYVEVFSGPVGINFRPWDWAQTMGQVYGISQGANKVLKFGGPKLGVYGAVRLP